jgi:hypothetical protein
MHAKELVSNRWLIATMCTVLQLCLGTVYAWSYFQPLLVEQFRWTNTDTSWAFGHCAHEAPRQAARKSLTCPHRKLLKKRPGFILIVQNATG